MPKQRAKPKLGEPLRRELEALPGVRRVILDDAPARIFVIGDEAEETEPLEASAQAVLARAGWSPEQIELNVSYSPRQPPRRVRFLSSRLERPRIGWASATVELEWAGKTYQGTAEGEGGLHSELRVCGLASTRALEAVLGGAVTLSLVGIKAIRIFDHDVVSVLLHTPEAPERQLVGVSIVTGEVYRSAALAVLNATNRLLGNYLATSD